MSTFPPIQTLLTVELISMDGSRLAHKHASAAHAAPRPHRAGRDHREPGRARPGKAAHHREAGPGPPGTGPGPTTHTRHPPRPSLPPGHAAAGGRRYIRRLQPMFVVCHRWRGRPRCRRPPRAGAAATATAPPPQPWPRPAANGAATAKIIHAPRTARPRRSAGCGCTPLHAAARRCIESSHVRVLRAARTAARARPPRARPPRRLTPRPPRARRVQTVLGPPPRPTPSRARLSGRRTRRTAEGLCFSLVPQPFGMPLKSYRRAAYKGLLAHA